MPPFNFAPPTPEMRRISEKIDEARAGGWHGTADKLEQYYADLARENQRRHQTREENDGE